MPGGKGMKTMAEGGTNIKGSWKMHVQMHEGLK